jgi:hypothetical protein
MSQHLWLPYSTMSHKSRPLEQAINEPEGEKRFSFNVLLSFMNAGHLYEMSITKRELQYNNLLTPWP